MSKQLSHLQAVTAGNATITLSNKSRHFTFNFKRGKPRAGQGVPPMFVKAKVEGKMRYAGVLYGTRVSPTAKSKMKITDVELRAANWMLNLLAMGDMQGVLNAGFRVQWSNTCVRCGRKLTTPSSIDGRLGPECAKILGLV